MQKRHDKLIMSATDLSNHLACRHLTELNRRAAHGELEKPFRQDEILKTLIERGLEHETAYVDYLRGQGKSIVEIRQFGGEESFRETISAMKRGVDLIVQGALACDAWSGRPDLLMRVEEKSDIGPWSYEVADTKLAQSTKGGTVLQLCLYSELLAEKQGVMPTSMAVVKPGQPFEVEHFRANEFLSYYRLVKEQLTDAISGATCSTYPAPVPHCDVCNWWTMCNQRRRDDDHLSFVAGIRKQQIAELTRQHVTTLEQFAESDSSLPEPPKHGALDAFDQLHHQAKVQHKARRSGELTYEFRELEDRRGFLKLPETDIGDVFFDIEGDPHAVGGGLEYLFGYVIFDGKGVPQYRSHWGLDRHSEKVAFERFIDFVMSRWAISPEMHVYHYAHYEPATMKRLSMRHATREDDVDRLLRGERFIDLYAVVRQGIRAGVESYSIKMLEPFYGYERLVPLEDARHSLHRLERALELGHRCNDEHKQVVMTYNKDDCLSTLALRNWLETLRGELVSAGRDIPRPVLLDGRASEDIKERTKEISDLFVELTYDLPETGRNQHEEARWLLAHLLDYFRREDKCIWWEYYRMHDLQPDELLLEREAIAYLEFEKEVPGGPRDRNPTHRYKFAPQDAHLNVGDTVVEVNGDTVGTVAHLDLRSAILDIKKRRDAVGVHPSSVFAFDRIRPEPLPESLWEFAQGIVDEPRAPDNDARYALLARKKPAFKTHSLPTSLEMKDAAVQLALDLDNSVLPIQGPPGAGKTFIGSHMVTELAAAGKRIGVTAVSHKVITNFLKAVVDQGKGTLVSQRLSSRRDGHPQAIEVLKATGDVASALSQGHIVGGTAWLWANDAMKDALDYLFIDEAGQMSLAVALAAGRAAKNIVLLGDPQQLEQPRLGSHPEGADVAALNHLLNGRETIPDDHGLFLPNTWRLHPSICDFISEQYYEGRLSSRPGLERQVIRGSTVLPEVGLAFLPVGHEGNETRSVEEAEAIRRVFEHLLDENHTWLDANSEERVLASEDIMIVAPYNAQVALLEDTLPGARVGTVDKFQGQEAAVVIYSVTSSSVDDAPRGMGFLYSSNRMNVATSRARCLVILVASPDILRPECATPEQIRLANGFCRFAELARTITLPT